MRAYLSWLKKQFFYRRQFLKVRLSPKYLLKNLKDICLEVHKAEIRQKNLVGILENELPLLGYASY